MPPFPRVLLLALILLFARPGFGQLTIEIIGGGANQVPIAIVPFGNEINYPLGVTGVIGADLQRSGLFRLIDPAGVSPRPTDAPEVRYPDWASRGAEALLIGQIQPLAGGEVEVRFRLLDVVKQNQLAGYSFVVTPKQFRATAHRIADVVYEALTGDRGVFSTKIAYITKSGRRFELQVADADGYGAETVVSSNEPLMSPAWSPEGQRIAYVSFEKRKPVVYVQHLSTGKRSVVAAFRGSNSAPAWSPDGQKLAVTLSKDGGSQLFLMNADGSNPERLMSSGSIDTEAYFSPDGESLLFTSDRGGSPQIYRMSLATRALERVSYEGSYNTSARFSPDGKGIVFVRREGGRLNIAVQDLASRQVQVLTSGHADEYPSFAPNGKMILYEADSGGRGILAAVSSDGRVKQRLVAAGSDVRQPAWGPLPKNP
ncbi:Tol-Pal system protein TolB [Burkholderiales bacterium]|nr:MAG: Tol-Pal system protein TolB [Burkholderiales bacterium]CAG1005378.1 Tol-Pal system protein TolB [Burkholderiales bacterium]